MDLPALDTQDARERMVDSQIRPNRVTNPVLLDALRAVRREAFVPPGLFDFAYIDEDLPLARGRVLMEPMVLARLLQALSPERGEKVLVVGSGTGYGATLLGVMGAQVVALEDDKELAALGASVLPPEVVQVSGPLLAGAKDHGPYDAILIQGGVPVIPASLVPQLKPGGRIATVVVGPGGIGTAVHAVEADGSLIVTKLFDCSTPMLPQLAPKPRFSFD